MTQSIRCLGSALAGATMFLAIGCSADESQPPAGEGASATVTVDTLERFQTMAGWEAVVQAGQEAVGFSGWKTALFDQAVNDLGINRLRLEARSGSENPSDYYVGALQEEDKFHRCQRWLTVNDNNDPKLINPAGFHFSEIDSSVVKVVQPIRQRLAARGEKLFVNFTYTAFTRQCESIPSYVHADPAEYAEFILAAFLHLRDSYGWVPDAVEIILEPDKTTYWPNGTVVGRALVATAARLTAAGFHPLYIAPSTADLGRGLEYIDDLYAVPGIDRLVGQLSFHRYGVNSEGGLAALARVAAMHGASTAMLEHIGSDVDDLYQDLTVAQVSAWEQFVLAFPGNGDPGGKYYMIIDNKPVMGNRSRYLRQYFHYVRIGARRVGATSNNSDLRPVAFQNADGRLAVVIHVERPGTIEVRGLRPSSYAASITTATSTGAELGESLVRLGGALRITATSVGVLTVYQK